MLGDDGQVLYVGKAKNLKNRVSSYFRKTALDSKTLALVSRIRDVDITVTGSETEALLLEQSFIKDLKPPYNIVFRDDKSYPYIQLSIKQEYPRLSFYRGVRKSGGKYFGPYPSAFAVRDSLNVLQKVFRVRQCEDSFFSNRSRPCLQYQIKRCSAPCCSLVSKADYDEDVRLATMFLNGKNQDVIEEYADRMEEASNALDFERAATFRDQMTHLRKIQEQQYVIGMDAEVDVMGAVVDPGGVCVQVLFFRGGRLLGNKTYFPKTRMEMTPGDVLEAFIPQFYLAANTARDIPREIVLGAEFVDIDLLQDTLSRRADRKVKLSTKVRGQRAKWVKLARTNAQQSLNGHLASRQNTFQRFEALQEGLALEDMPQRIECFDISHSSGEATVASCVVFNTDGPLKSDYRRFNIEGITGGDDYAAMAQALSRRYKRIKSGEGTLPDVLFIDGGKGQLHEAEKVLQELQIDGVVLVGIAKGPERRPGMESLFISGKSGEVNMPSDSPALHLIQHIRDESHRFAITAHRQRRARKRNQSPLENIAGVGPGKRRALLRFFGGLQQISSAGVEELAKVDGISMKLAEHIYDTLHGT